MKSKGWNLRVFKREQRSLFGEILDWMLTPLLLLWPISLALTWLVAQGLANKPFDRALVHNVHALAQQVKLGPDKNVEFNLPQPASELLRADETDLVYYQVRGARNEHLSGERDLPLPKPNEPKGSSYEVHIATTKCAAWKYAWPTPGSDSMPRANGLPWCKWLKRGKSALCWPQKSSRA